MYHSDDPDAEALRQLYPALARIGEQLIIPSGPLAGQPVVIRRLLTEHGGVLFTLRYENGSMRDWEWLD